MKIAIATDSSCGLSQKESKDLGIFVLPLPITVNQTTFYEGKDLSYEKYYQYLNFENEVSTSQPSPGELIEFWDSILNQGYDQIVYLPISSNFSSSYITASQLAERYDDKIHVVDNQRISVTQYHACLDALKLIDQGHTAKEIKEILEDQGGNCLILIGFDTLDYLKQGGRLVLSTVAKMGDMLNIRPVVSLLGDKVDGIEISRGVKQAKRKLLSLIEEYMDQVKELGHEYYICSGGTFKDQEKAKEWQEMVAEVSEIKDISYENLSASVASHAGPDAFGFAISKKI